MYSFVHKCSFKEDAYSFFSKLALFSFLFSSKSDGMTCLRAVEDFLHQMAEGIEFLRENRLLTSLIENGGLHPNNIALDDGGEREGRGDR